MGNDKTYNNSKTYVERKEICNILHYQSISNVDALKYIDEIKKIDNEIGKIDKDNFDKINSLRFKKKELQERLYEKMNVPVEVSGVIQIEIQGQKPKYESRIHEDFQKSNSIGQFLIMLHFKPLPLDKDNMYPQELLGCGENRIGFNENKEIIYLPNSASKEKREDRVLVSNYDMHHYLLLISIFKPFLDSLKLDNNLRHLLKDIFNNNLLVRKDYDKVFNYVCDGLKKNIRSALTVLIPQFEYSCRIYIESQGVFPVINKNGKDCEITLNEMFINSQFRQIIENLIGKEITQGIEFLTCKSLGPQIRNKIAHKGLGDDAEYTNHEIALFFYLIRAYCMGYDNNENI